MEQVQLIERKGERLSMRASIAYMFPESQEVVETLLKRAPRQAMSFATKEVQKGIANKTNTNVAQVSSNEDGDYFVKYDGKSFDINEPIRLNQYTKDIPAKVLKKIHTLETNKDVTDSSIMNEFPFDYYVADVINNPDPILFVQMGGLKELTFVVGTWE